MLKWVIRKEIYGSVGCDGFMGNTDATSSLAVP